MFRRKGKGATEKPRCFSHLTSKDPYSTRELPVRHGLVVFDNYSEHVTEIFSSQFCMFIDAHVLSPTRLIRTTVNTEKGHFSVVPSVKISCRQSLFMDTGNH